MEYVLSVGTNIGDREQNIADCAAAVGLLPDTVIKAQSAVYETEPVGYDDQQNFYNVLFKVESGFDPHEMLGACLGIEAGLGRVRTIKNGPRIIDIDIIFAEDLKISSKNLVIPHPRYSERRFVLGLLPELFDDGIVYGTDIKPMLKKLKGQNIKKVIKKTK